MRQTASQANVELKRHTWPSHGNEFEPTSYGAADLPFSRLSRVCVRGLAENAALLPPLLRPLQQDRLGAALPVTELEDQAGFHAPPFLFYSLVSHAYAGGKRSSFVFRVRFR